MSRNGDRGSDRCLSRSSDRSSDRCRLGICFHVLITKQQLVDIIAERQIFGKRSHLRWQPLQDLNLEVALRGRTVREGEPDQGVLR